MFGDIGWTELLLIGVVALIVIGPEDLPEMFRQLGRITAKIRAMAREFQRAMEQAAKESGVDDVARDLKTVASPKSLGLNAVKEAADKFEKWDPLKPAAKPVKPAAASMVADAPAVGSEAAEPSVEGPATQALRAKQTQRKAILRETAEKLKAVNEGNAVPPEPPAKTAAKAAGPAAAKATAPARAPRKKKAPEA
jgi:sec-independent protein translocase protein TatB